MGSNQLLGTASHLSNSSKNLILKVESKTAIGDAVLDNAGKRIGTVFDLFGPVSNPFVAVRPEIDEPERYIGEPLFLRIRRR